MMANRNPRSPAHIAALVRGRRTKMKRAAEMAKTQNSVSYPTPSAMYGASAHVPDYAYVEDGQDEVQHIVRELSNGTVYAQNLGHRNMPFLEITGAINHRCNSRF